MRIIVKIEEFTVKIVDQSGNPFKGLTARILPARECEISIDPVYGSHPGNPLTFDIPDCFFLLVIALPNENNTFCDDTVSCQGHEIVLPENIGIRPTPTGMEVNLVADLSKFYKVTCFVEFKAEVLEYCE